MASVQRRILLLAGVMLVGVVVVALLSWPALVKQFHLYRLRTEPGYLVDVLNAERARSQEEALRSFSRTPAGRAALFQLCVDGVLTPPRLELVDEALEAYIESGPGALALQQAFVEAGSRGRASAGMRECRRT